MDVEWQWWQSLSDVAQNPFDTKGGSAKAKSDSSSANRLHDSRQAPFARLEEVMDIIRLHRLGEDLDLRSLCQMRLSNKTFGRIAARMLQPRVQGLEFVLSPFTDGFAVFGHSRFVRRTIGKTNETIIHFEHGRPVEYVRCGVLPLTRESDFLFNAPPQANQWSCEELLLGNLDQMTGDIAIREYCGQKLCLFWKPHGPDALHHELIKVGEVWIEASPKAGKRVCKLHHSQLNFSIQNSKTRQYQDIMVEYNGEMVVENLHLDLRTLIQLPSKRCCFSSAAS